MKRFWIGFGLACGWLGLLGLRAFAAPPEPAGPRANSAGPAARGSPLAPQAADDPGPVTGKSRGFDPAAAASARFLAIGGGATPESTEVSLEQDMNLARQIFPGPGLLFFAGGADAISVRSLDPSADPSSLLVRLGQLFAPRVGRASRYRRPALTAAAATLDNVELALTGALRDGSGPLLVYIAAHGEQGEQARDNYVDLWGGEPLTVARLAAIHDGAPARPLRLLIASCHSGGFGELAFAAADAAKGPARAPRCGLFAGPWDRQTSGCDPNPDRRVQEGYSLHVLHALRGQDRQGRALAPKEIDFDGDGKIGLLEAHTRARIASTSIDVPTTTSERFLREVEHRHGNIGAAGLPEEQALITQLGGRLGLTTRASADRRWRELSGQLDALDQRLAELDETLRRAEARLAALLLGRYPVLDDPYHPEFAPVLKKHGAAIQAILDGSAEARAFARSAERVAAVEEQQRELEPQEAVVMRLLRAYETAALAAALKARGGPSYQHYRALLACERAGL